MVGKYKWPQGQLPDDEVQILLELVTAAGFKAGKVVPGKLLGNYLEQDGSPTGETFPVNVLCPFKVLCAKSTDYHHATGWLDRVVYLATTRSNDPALAAEEVQKEVERSVPLPPIQLTVEGDRLREYPRSGRYLTDHVRDHNKLESCVGVHDFCGGFVDRRGATPTHDALTCRSCNLRVLFPKEVTTFGELRQAMQSKLNAAA